MTLLRLRLLPITTVLFSLFATSLSAQERWFQIELSIFTNEPTADRAEEYWQADRTELTYPENLRRLDLLSDLLRTDELILNSNNFSESNTFEREDLSAEQIQAEIRAEAIAAIGPIPASEQSGFKLFDFAREDFVQLPSSLSDFQQTNRTLERSGDHRLLFHGLWRQAVVQPNRSEPVYIEGGLAYGEQHELQGSLTIRFNEGEDRVVIDTNLWLTEFSIVENPNNQWTLPAIPDVAQDSQSALNSDLRYNPIMVYRMQQSREMRSNEFHYLDHPAIGIVIQVEPYEVPLAPLATESF